ncbi:MAG: hypothetical protein HY319_31215 [Armatimonadetes bacterium]|nr:hypothetical protein [Armatimonadota bacterium]
MTCPHCRAPIGQKEAFCGSCGRQTGRDATWACPRCGETHDQAFDACWKCSSAGDPLVTDDEPSVPSIRQLASELVSKLREPVGGRQDRGRQDGDRHYYYGLRAVAGYFKVLAWLSAAPWLLLMALSLFGGIGSLSGDPLSGLVTLILGPLLCAVIAAALYLTFTAAAESILVILDIESNTRRAAENLEGRLR